MIIVVFLLYMVLVVWAIWKDEYNARSVKHRKYIESYRESQKIPYETIWVNRKSGAIAHGSGDKMSGMITITYANNHKITFNVGLEYRENTPFFNNYDLIGQL